jgi:hypothetical protein
MRVVFIYKKGIRTLIEEEVEVIRKKRLCCHIRFDDGIERVVGYGSLHDV